MVESRRPLVQAETALRHCRRWRTLKTHAVVLPAIVVDVVEGLRVGVRSFEEQAATGAAAQRRLEGMIVGIQIALKLEGLAEPAVLSERLSRAASVQGRGVEVQAVKLMDKVVAH